jgi:hypothetical protein
MRTLVRTIAAWSAVLFLGVSSTAGFAQDKLTADEAHAIPVEAYVYFYPLVTMDVTRKQLTNIEPGKEFGKGPMNMFVSMPEYPPAISRALSGRTSTRCIRVVGSTLRRSRR